MLLNKNILAIGIVFLFTLSALTPITFGHNVEISGTIEQPSIIINYGNPPEEEWNKTFGGVDNDWGMSVFQTNDGGFILMGTTVSFGAGDEDIWLVKTDKDGNKEWDKTFGGFNDDRGESVSQTSDGGYIFTGSTLSYDPGNLELWLIKTDENGNKQWDKTFGGTGWDYGFDVELTSDDGYIIIGITSSYGAGDLDFWLIKTDENGYMQWNKTFGGAGLDFGVDVLQTSDYGYIITGFTTSFGAGFEDIWLIKTDADGNKQWDKTFGGVEYERGYCVQQTSDGGYIITGYTESYDPGNFDVWLIKTDADGNLQWDKTYGDQPLEFGNSVLQTNDNGYIICGVDADPITKHDVLLIKTDETGSLQWSKTYGGFDYDEGKSVQLTSDGGYIIIGYTHSFGAGEFDFWLIKLKGDNQPPNKPTITGETNGKIGVEYEYTFSSEDSNGDGVIYHIDWDDGNFDTTGVNPPGVDVKVKHSWNKEGTYTIRAFAEDEHGLIGPEGTLTVTMPRNRATYNSLFLRFLEQFPILRLFQR